MQHLGEISEAQRSRGKSKQDKQEVKARKEIQKRSFWRRFFSSFLSLLKEKRPSETKGKSDPRRGAEFPSFVKERKLPATSKGRRLKKPFHQKRRVCPPRADTPCVLM